MNLISLYFFNLITCTLANGYGSTPSSTIFPVGLLNPEDHVEFDCGRPNDPGFTGNKKRLNHETKYSTIGVPTRRELDPYQEYQQLFNKIIFGPRTLADRDENGLEKVQLKQPKLFHKESLSDPYAQFPCGQFLRSEIYQNKTSVHLPFSDLMHRGHLYLELTSDYMQTALNAFAILLKGNLEDVLRLPAHYVLKSAKTIAMMKIAREKLAAMWTVVKNGKSPDTISHRVLQQYRPLFKYLNGREMARLNMSDDRILNYIGTHSELDRHQVGVVASEYINQNRFWMEPRYLNLMNNLLCGVPMNFMRRIPESTYLQLTHQLFYHIHACDPLQRRFYFAMMTRTRTLGKPYSWSARDVSRLGLLLSEIHGPDLATVNPEAMSGLTAQVMLEIPAESLKHVTEMQLRYISHKPLNILAKRLRDYQDQQRTYGKGNRLMSLGLLEYYTVVIIVLTCLMK